MESGGTWGPSGNSPARRNRITPEGWELGKQIARLCDGEIAKLGRDERCGTCAFRAGDHLANGSPETLMTALKAAAERTPFWCHERDRPCAGWLAMRSDAGDERVMPWEHCDEAPPLSQQMDGRDHGGSNIHGE